MTNNQELEKSTSVDLERKMNHLDCDYKHTNDMLSVFIRNGIISADSSVADYIRVFNITCPSADTLLHDTISSILAFATSINYKNRDHKITTAFKVPLIFNELIQEYNKLQNYNNVEFTNICGSRQTLKHGNSSKVVILYSGGKDSFYQLAELLGKYNKKNIVGVYVKGGMINAEFAGELDVTKKLFSKKGIPLKILEAWHSDYRSPLMRMSLRGAWRDLLLLSLSKNFSDDIATGINQDDMYHLDPLSVKDKFCSNIFLFFSETKLAVEKMSELLNIKVYGVPSEFKVYAKLQKTHPDFLKNTQSCFDPKGECDFTRMCYKCFSMYIYDKFIKRESFTDADVNRILSEKWIGCSEFIEYARLLKNGGSQSGILSKKRELDEMCCG